MYCDHSYYYGSDCYLMENRHIDLYTVFRIQSMSSPFPQLTPVLRKHIRSLHRNSLRDEMQQFLVEGTKLCEELVHSNFQTSFIVIRNKPNEDIYKTVQEFLSKGVEVFGAESSQFDSLCDAKTPQDILAVVRYPLAKSEIIHNRIIVLDRVADPGNVGTIIRTAEWFGFESIVLGEGCADRFNPKTVRSTMGSLFRLSVQETNDVENYLSNIPAGYGILGAVLNGEKELNECTRLKKIVLVFGNESSGIKQSLLRHFTGTYRIEGYGEAESLNVAVAAGISMFHFANV